MNIIETTYFPSLPHAIAYYRPQGFSALDVKRKLDEGEIHVGKPPMKEGQTCFEKGFRWHVQSNTP